MNDHITPEEPPTELTNHDSIAIETRTSMTPTTPSKPNNLPINDTPDLNNKNSIVGQVRKLPGVVSGAQKRFTMKLNVQTYEILKTITKPMSKNELNKSSAKIKKQRIKEEPPFRANGFLTPYARRTMPSRADLSFNEVIDLYIRRPEAEAQYAAKLAARKGKLCVVRPLPGLILGDPGFGQLQLPRRLTPKVAFVHDNGRGKKMTAYAAAYAKSGFPMPSKLDHQALMDEIEETQLDMNRRMEEIERKAQKRIRRLMAKHHQRPISASDILCRMTAPAADENPIVNHHLLSPMPCTPSAHDSANTSLVDQSDTDSLPDESIEDEVLFS